MKVYITDIRNNPRIVYIDGRRYVFPSRKEVLKDISLSAYRTLSKTPYIHVRLESQEDSTVEEIQVEEPKKEIVKEETSKEEIKVVEEKVEAEIIPLEEVTPVLEEQVSNTPDYSSMTKKELRSVLEEKGVDTSGMTKSNMLDWLKENQ